MSDLFKAFVLGVVEGLTEFLPVSSTGHLLLLEHFFGFDDDAFGKTFVVLIQLGAILALLSIYFTRLWKIALALPYAGITQVRFEGSAASVGPPSQPGSPGPPSGMDLSAPLRYHAAGCLSNSAMRKLQRSCGEYERQSMLP